MPRRETHLRSLPTHRAGALYAYNDGAQSGPSLSWNARHCDSYSPNNAHGCAYCHSGYANIILALPPETPSRGAAQSQLIQWCAENPDVTSDKWCTEHADCTLPFRYAGQYVPCIQDVRTGENRVISTERFSCWHCANKLALAAATARGNHTALPLLYSEDHLIADHLLPSSPEIEGDAPPTGDATIKDASEELGRTCGNCGRMNHNSRTCEFPAKSHLKIGIEIEGGWIGLRAVRDRATAAGIGGCGDGSVRCDGGWEFQTKPGSLREALQQLVDFYPDFTNKTCGMHVHVSFSPDSVTLLNTKQFCDFFKARWTAWADRMNLARDGEFRRRLRGDNDYCNPNDDEIPNILNMDRYHQLNFSAWDEHKTVECRLLPMFQHSSLGVAAVQELVAIFEDFLGAVETHGLVFPTADIEVQAPTEQRFSATAELDVPETLVYNHVEELELEDILPPAPGFVRIALPEGQTITAARLREIAAVRSAA